MKLTVLYEDDFIIAIDKPAGLASIPERKLTSSNLLVELTSAGTKLFVVHRLDKEVSGVIIFAKTSQSHRFFCQLFQDHHLEKKYVAVVHGRVVKGEGLIDIPIRQFGSGRMGVDPRAGKNAVTRYTVLSHGERCSYLEVRPETGKRHQIRVHLYHHGHAIVGDLRYGDRQYQAKFPRLMLHASQLSFEQMTGKKVSIESPLPDSFLPASEPLLPF